MYVLRKQRSFRRTSARSEFPWWQQ